MICPKCDVHFGEDKKFCRNCGTSLVSDQQGKKLRKKLFFTGFAVYVAVFAIISAGTIFAAKYFFYGARPAAHLNTPEKLACKTVSAPADASRQAPENDDMALKHEHGRGWAQKSGSLQVKTDGGEYETTAELIEDGSDNLGLRISIKPNDAVLYFDGQMRGYAPLEVRDLLPGKHVIGIFKPGYKTRNITVNLVSGVEKECTISLERKQADVPFGLRLMRDPLGADRS
jgi:PEGA domain